MRLRNIISVCLLAVYAIVVAHNFIPHHHHSEIAESTHTCNHEDHFHVDSGNAILDQSHDSDAHLHCSFNEKIILTKVLTLPLIYLAISPYEFVQCEENSQLLNDIYNLVLPQENHCRDVLLRGPPQFS